ncbi:MAG: YfhO family protein [Vicinamibacteria bacterium]|jgi:hypothetical protein|nr:YfhO family protein [Vicinamibacteria bacterium]
MYAWLAAMALLLFRGEIFGEGVFYYRDIHLAWQPQIEALVKIVRGGAWPTWNPYSTFGMPLLANPNNQVFYPPTWLNFILRPWTYFTLYVATHALFTAVGAYTLARRLTLTRPAALTAAGLWMLSGPFLSLVSLWNHFAGAAWIPWIAWAGERAAASRRLTAGIVLGTACAACVFAGSVEMALIGLLVAGALMARYVRVRPFDWRGNAVLIRAFAASLIFALGLSAAQWIPSLELMQRSARAMQTHVVREYWSIHPAQLAETIWPLDLDALPLRPELRALLFESREPYLPSLYLGLAGGVLVWLGLLHEQRGLRLSLLCMAGTGIVLACGRHVPLVDHLVAGVPIVNALRFPAKAIVATAFAWSLLAGLGVDRLAHRGPTLARGRLMARWLVPASVVLIATFVILLLILFGAERIGPAFLLQLPGLPLDEQLAPLSARLAIGGMLALMVLLLALRCMQRARGTPILIAGVAALAMLDVFLAHEHLNHPSRRELYTHRPAAAELLKDAAGTRVYSFDYFLAGRPERYLGHSSLRLKIRRQEWPVPWLDALALRDGLYPTTLHFSGLLSSYEVDALRLQGDSLAALTRFLFDVENTPAHARLLQMGAVHHVIALHHQGLADLALIATLPSLFIEPLSIYRVPDPLDRCYVVARVLPSENRDVAALIQSAEFDPHRTVILPRHPGLAEQRHDFSGRAWIEYERADRIRIRAQANAPAVVVLVDSYDPNWRVHIDERPAPLLRANVAFRGVAIPAGEHHIDLSYWPRGLTLALVVSSVFCVAGLLILMGSAARTAEHRATEQDRGR